jgi:hypothetical protein
MGEVTVARGEQGEGDWVATLAKPLVRATRRAMMRRSPEGGGDGRGAGGRLCCGYRDVRAT